MANLLDRNDNFFMVHNKFSNIPLSNPVNFGGGGGNLGEREEQCAPDSKSCISASLAACCVNSGFRGGIHEIFALLGFYDTLTAQYIYLSYRITL